VFLPVFCGEIREFYLLRLVVCAFFWLGVVAGVAKGF
jgi:hypothetical protein